MLEVLLPAIVLGGAVMAIVAFSRWFKQRWLEALTHVARTFGLTIDGGSFWRSAKAHGVVSQVPVVLDTYTVSTGKSSTTYTRITARPATLARDFTLKREGIGASLGKLFLGDDVAVGDEAFDRTAIVRGNEVYIRAVLDHETRDLIETTLAMGIVVEDGEVRWVQSGLVRDVNQLEHAMRRVVALARALDPGSVRARLLHVVQTDPNDEVMAGALSAFLGKWRLEPEEEAALLAHRREAVRLTVAPYVGERAWDVVVGVLDDVRVPTPLRVRAFEILQRIDRARAVPLALERIGRTQPTEVAVALLALLAAAQTCPPLAELADLVALRSEPLRLALAECLAHSAENAEAQLLEMLAESDERVATAAARGLARHGTTHAVTPLRERAKGFLVGSDLKRAVEATIATIQSQVGSHLGGSLSLLREQRAEGGLSIQKAESFQGDD